MRNSSLIPKCFHLWEVCVIFKFNWQCKKQYIKIMEGGQNEDLKKSMKNMKMKFSDKRKELGKKEI